MRDQDVNWPACISVPVRRASLKATDTLLGSPSSSDVLLDLDRNFFAADDEDDGGE